MQPPPALAAFLLGAALLLPACQKSPPAMREDAAILTPPAPATPRINGAKIFGARPNSPFLFQIAATGERPMEFSATGLPEGLSLDPATGRITGASANPGEYAVTLAARNAFGATERPLRIRIGEEIALTPLMGWNSWNVWGGRVSEEKVRAAAHALAATGLRDHGWSYVNIDDGWQGTRGGTWNAIQPNEKFPDLPKLADEIHSLGLKLGLYSTPWRTSFHGHIGSSADFEDGSNDWIRSGTHDTSFMYAFPKDTSLLARYAVTKPMARWRRERQRKKITRRLRTFGKHSFVAQDVAQWEAWGVDYLKYDWSPIDLPHAEEMSRALRAARRDIVFSVANNASFENGSGLSKVANAWRTSGDVRDSWESVSKVGFSRDRWAPLNRPGHYNDPDMLVLGEIGWGKDMRRTRLTANEQYAHFSLWCLLSAPLLLGCDLAKLDAFTFGLITNDEVLEVNQDALCKQATRVTQDGAAEVYAKEMEDGSWAIGLFNRGKSARPVKVQWSVLGLRGPQSVRDPWRQKDLGVFEDRFEEVVSPHGVVLIRTGPRRQRLR